MFSLLFFYLFIPYQTGYFDFIYVSQVSHLLSVTSGTVVDCKVVLLSVVMQISIIHVLGWTDELKTPPVREKCILLLFKFPNILKLFLAKNRRCRNYSAGKTLKHKSFEVNCTHFRKSQTKHDVALFFESLSKYMQNNKCQTWFHWFTLVKYMWLVLQYTISLVSIIHLFRVNEWCIRGWK